MEPNTYEWEIQDASTVKGTATWSCRRKENNKCHQRILKYTYDSWITRVLKGLFEESLTRNCLENIS